MGLFLSLLLSLSGGALAQGDGHVPGMSVETTMSLTSVGDLDGTGHLEITVTGEHAAELRQHILSEYDGDMNQVIDREEARETMVALADAISGRTYWGVTMNVTTDFANVTLTDMSNWVVNLIHTDWESTADLRFSMDIGCRGAGFSKVIFITEGAVDTFVDGFSDCTGYAFEGSMHLSHRVVAFGFGSFAYPEIVNGTIQELRSPAGTVIWYSCDFEVEDFTAMTQETISYERFSLAENQQFAFAVLLIGSLLIARMPKHRFENFRKLHPKKYRKYARPKNSVRISAVAVLAAIWIPYLLPFIFSFLASDFMVYSYYFLFIVPAGVVTEYVFSRRVYNRSALDIPEEAVIEVKQAMVEADIPTAESLCSLCYKPIEVPEEVQTCDSCGTEMHVECADRAQACPNCGGILFPQDTRSIECKSCGESFLHTGKEDPYSIQCTRCGAFQEEVEASKNYLVVDKDPTMAYRMIRAMGISGRPAMVMTTEFPGKTRANFELGEEVDVRWFSDSTTDIDNVNPKDLEGDAMETASTFLMTTKRAGLLIDGVDVLIEMNGFDRVMAFIRRMNDLAMIHGSSILMFTYKVDLDEEQYRAISEEFDEIHDYL
ncbi:TPA: DUF835 domain-containing protein [Thermoplasmata archaeon]|nr:DUF835 domain-containing protein [Thermoplasmata archaeon]